MNPAEIFVILCLVAWGSLALRFDDHEDAEINVFEVDDFCPTWDNQTKPSTCPADEQRLSPCVEDYQCKIGSRCCQTGGCMLKYCVDTTEGSVSAPMPIGMARPNRRTRRRVIRRCTACACQRLCRTDRDCRRGRRRKCYQNSCSSYCIKA